MKILYVLLAVLFLSVQAEAQSIRQKDVPDKVKQSIESRYPQASKVKWEMHDGMYEATFTVNDQKTSAVFSSEGVLSESESEITVDQLPELVKYYLTNHLSSETIEEIEMETDAHGVVTYEVETDGGEYIFSADGKLLSKEMDDDEDGDDEGDE